MRTTLAVAVILAFLPAYAPLPVLAQEASTITITKDQFEALKKEANRELMSKWHSNNKAEKRVRMDCDAILAACAVAAAGACIFECTVGGGTTGPDCSACLDQYGDSCARPCL